jgi:adenylate cyclase
MFVAGEAGAGKTALLQTFIDEAVADHEDLRVAVGDCNAQGGVGDPYLPFREILATLMGVSPTDRVMAGTAGGDPLSRIVKRSGQILREVGPDLIGAILPGVGLAAVVGKEIAERTGLINTADDDERGAASVDQDRVFEQYANVLRALAEDAPLLIVIDDLHWADDASIGLLFHLSRRLDQSRILLIGSYRPDEIATITAGDDRRVSLAKVLAEIKRYGGDVTIDLDVTTEDERREFAAELIDSEPNHLSASTRSQLFARTSGHPLFTVELLRALQERGDLVKDDEGAWVARDIDWDTLPARVEGVIEERIGRLGNGEREIIEAASIEGPVFTAEVVAKLTGQRPREVLDRLSADLERRHRLVSERGEVPAGENVLSAFQFTHALFQRYLYAELGPARQRVMHAEVGAALEELCAGQPERLSPMLAWHFDLGAKRDRAAHYYSLAGRRAINQGAPAASRKHLDRALALLPSGDDEARWTILVARDIALLNLGDQDARRANCDALFELARRTNDDRRLALAFRIEAQRRSHSGDQHGILEPARQAAAMAAELGDPVLESESLALTAHALVRVGDVPGSIAAISSAVAAAGGLDAASLSVLRAAWIVAYESGDIARGLDYATSAIAAARRGGDRGGEASMLNNRGLNLAMLGRYDDAQDELESAVATARAAGWRREHGYALQNLALVLMYRGRVDDAELSAAESLRVFDGTGDEWGRGGSTYYMGLIVETAGRPGEAESWNREARDAFTGVGALGIAAEASAALARCALALGRIDEAVTHTEAVMTRLDTFGSVGMESPARVATSCADVFLAAGDADRARRALELGHRELLDRAGRITDDAMRTTFLQNVPEHRALLRRMNDAS